MSWNLRKLLTPRDQCTSTTNPVLSLYERFTASHKSMRNRVPTLFDRLRGYSNCMSWYVRKVITRRVPCRTIKNRVPTLFDRFTAYYNFMSWSIRKLIPPRVQYTSITKPVLELFDGFTASHNCMNWNVSRLITLRINTQVSQIVFLAHLTVLRLMTTVWA